MCYKNAPLSYSQADKIPLRAVAAMALELRQLVDTANAPIFGIDVHGNVNEWNQKTAEITGYTAEEALNKPLVKSFIVPKLKVSVQEVMDNALKGMYCLKENQI